MAVVEGGQLGLTEAFDDGKHSCIDESDVRVCVSIAQLSDPHIIVALHLLDAICARDHIIQQRNEYSRVHARVHPVVYFHHDRGRNDQRFLTSLDEGSTQDVIRVASVERGVQRAGV